MKPTATGRILLWRGGSLWIGLAGEPTGLHAHHAVQIALPFPHGRVRFQRPSGSWLEGHPAKAGWPLYFQRRLLFIQWRPRFTVFHDVTKSKLSADDTPAPKNNLQS